MAAIIKLLSKFDDSGIRKAKSSFNGLSKTVGALGIGLGLGSLVNYAKTATQGFEQAEIASSKLANVMESMGVGMSTARVDAYAESLQNLVAVDADVIKSAQTKLATFSNLAMSADTAGGMFDRATVATLDLAAVFGGDASRQAVALGKALQDPVRGITALRKQGVDFTEEEKQKIKTLVQTNKVLEAQDYILGVIEKQVGGTAAAGASVFDRMKLSMDSVSDELGGILLPYLKDFADFLMKDVVPNVKSFLQDLSNPDTEAGKTFQMIKDAVMDAYNGVKDFFALFGGGDAMKGFGVVASNLIKMLPALLALKGIMMLASAGKAIQSLVTAMTLIQGKGGVDAIVGGGKGGKGKGGGLPLLGTAALTGVGLVLMTSGSATGKPDRDLSNFDPKTGGPLSGLPKTPSFILPKGAGSTTNNVTINVQGADPKTTVDALGKYLKQNGSLPFNLGQAGR
jgi:ribosomal protein L12E/L44/L45/RPP1/RPP2